MAGKQKKLDKALEQAKREAEKQLTDRDLILEGVARAVLGLETLATRKSDSLDFHELAVWQIKKALETAYGLGFVAGESSK